MEIVPLSYLEQLKKYCRRRRYQRLSGANKIKRKLQITRLGDNRKTRRHWKLRVVPKLMRISPLKLLARFHDSYVDLMVKLVSNVAKSANNGGVLAGKNNVAKEKQISFVSCGKEVDSKLVLEIYKRLAASRSLPAY